MIRLVTFDALFTLIRPRRPIIEQYGAIFQPYLGTLCKDAMKQSFKTALKALQKERPVYALGHEEWWTEVIRRTAMGAGADKIQLERHLPEIVPTLLHRFSSKEGYEFYPDALPTIRSLQRAGIRVGVITNADNRIRSVMESLEASVQDGDGQPLDLAALLISDEVGVEKPQAEIFNRACQLSGVTSQETMHVGDELECDYWGATRAGLHARLVRRPGPLGAEAAVESGEDLTHVHTILDLNSVLQVVHSL